MSKMIPKRVKKTSFLYKIMCVAGICFFLMNGYMYFYYWTVDDQTTLVLPLNPHLPESIPSFAVYVVNLEHRMEKWNETYNQATKASSILSAATVFERHNATYGESIDFANMVKNNQLSWVSYRSIISWRSVNGVRMTAGGLGCSLSHYRIWKIAVERQISILVLEDDIQVLPEFDKLFPQALLDVPNDYGMIYLANMLNARSVREHQHEYGKNKSVWRLSGKYWGTYAYLISPSTAKILVDNFFPMEKQVDSYIMAITQEHKIPVFRTKTNLVSTDNSRKRISDVQKVVSKDLRIVPALQNVHIILSHHLTENTLRPTRLKKYLKNVFNGTVSFWPPKKLRSHFPSAFEVEKSKDSMSILRLQLDVLYQEGGLLFTLFEDLTEPGNMSKLIQTRLPPLILGVRGIVFYHQKGNIIRYPLIAALPKAEWVHKLRLEMDRVALLKKNNEELIWSWLQEHLDKLPNGENNVLAPYKALW